MVRIIFYVIFAVLVLSFFGISIQSVVHSPAGEANFGYVGDLVVSGFRFITAFILAGITWLKNLIP
jgi:hypothetical protein